MTRFGRASVSLRLYPHNDLAAPAIVDERAQAALAADTASTASCEQIVRLGDDMLVPLRKALA
ncbi:MAG: hypothetical protein ACR2IR_06905 [Acidimicrobiia bacterium]